MSNGQTVILAGDYQRRLAQTLIAKAPQGAVVNIREASRTLDQNAKLHAMVSDVARAKPEGRVYPVDVWKPLFLAMCGHKMRFEPALDGNGVVPIGFRTSRLTKAQCAELIECIYAYGAEHGVKWSDETEQAA